MSSDRVEKNRAILRVLNTLLEQNDDSTLLLVEKDIETLGAAVDLGANQVGRALDHLIDSGYIDSADRGTGYGRLVAVAIKGLTEKGYDLLEHGRSIPGAASGQSVSFHNATIGNAAFANHGSASITNSPVTQGAEVLQRLFDQLREAIDRSTASEADKADAKVEAEQLRLELEKNKKNPGRIRELLTSIPTLVQNAATVVKAIEGLGKLADTF